jgi:DNA-binding winged helix-turn-helix (wHTH) protein
MRNIESEAKQKLNEAKTKRKRSEMKRNGKEFCLASMQKKCLSHLTRNENEMKRKQNEKGSKNFEAKKDKGKFWASL